MITVTKNVPSSCKLFAALTMSGPWVILLIWEFRRFDKCCILATLLRRSEVSWSRDSTIVCISILLNGSMILLRNRSTADKRLWNKNWYFLHVKLGTRIKINLMILTCIWDCIIKSTPSNFSTHVAWDSRSSWLASTCLCNSAFNTSIAKHNVHILESYCILC